MRLTSYRSFSDRLYRYHVLRQQLCSVVAIESDSDVREGVAQAVSYEIFDASGAQPTAG